ncbi:MULTISPECIES: AzlC family ABC transporter permease [unclassified Mesorhizobium]|uniref:AzlC family ABC transporter permease n=1 Tax=unclassified Mesorhizobium TaxID=325217 RepID=UPI000FCAAEB2|nr:MULTISPECIES: AzlC family ABC transporter permease [unclassified Mesorhizobium]TGP23176.1 branched-chain amino acid ABC transporter permease [Mesorhizobium sp. M1D.F.Ca.ET.231.01.1.1]TGP32238.1 branched-chain amino acid ABC transporter permease [Mesorhizobium sp. M1D.F.Ca.ET.234.01.1.1]TGS46702.1 branched-chain amino acid ABC transporter permease [Mesorhizobium sp. M1D.F.Ca.ET.184.01.1.1]TGS61528.1 branched-chain amino acid ABC transporter permease [Mesorhizobium sp. M1D.F.Ca.ET.183.01.1.1]
MSAEAISEDRAKSEFWDGVRLSMPVVVASAPFAVLFGALAVDNGFSVLEAFLMSALIFGGASQMVGIELFGQHVAPWLIVLSIFAVNFRHVLYSAGLGRRIAHWPVVQQALGFFIMTDPQYAVSEARAQSGETVGFAWYLGLGLPVYVFWVIESALGAVFGKMIPDTHALGIDFLLPIYFLGLVVGFRKRPLWLPVVAASAAASIIAYKNVGSPWHVSIGAVAGVLLAVILPPHHSGVGERP